MPFVCAAARGESDFIRAFAWTQNLEISEEELPAHETYFKKSTRQLIEALSGTINSSCTITPSPKKETPSPQKTGGVSFKTEALDFSLHPAPPKPPSTIFSTNSAFNQSKNSSPTTKESGGRVV